MKNIIFDVGSVLIGYRWRDMCLDHGMDEETAGRISRGFFENPLWPDFDAGFITIEAITETMVKEMPDLEQEIRWFIGNAELMVVERPEIWKLVRKLKEKGYGIYILSNYSEDLFTIHTKGLEFMELLDGGVVSYQVHEIKPNPAIYERLLEKYHLKAEECLFFDDRPENTEAAQKLGFAAVTVENGSEEFLKKELEKL